MKFINDIFNGYQWAGIKGFFLSMFPSIKYELTLAIISLSSIGATVELLFGFKMWTFGCFIVAAVMELTSGIYASAVVQKQPLQSSKMGRFAFKLILLFAGLYILHGFANEYEERIPWVSSLFNWVYVLVFVVGALEYAISILENRAIIEGKPKEYYTKRLREKLDGLLSKKPSKIDGTNQTDSSPNSIPDNEIL